MIEVQRHQCKTCIFRAEYWPADRLKALLDEIADDHIGRLL